VLLVRVEDAACGLVLRLPELRLDQRLLVTEGEAGNGGPGFAPAHSLCQNPS